MSDRYCLVHYHELGLKGRNRFRFERRLRDNLDAALVSCEVGPVERIAGRLLVPVTSDSLIVQRAVAERVALVPGVARVSLVRRTDRVLENIFAAVDSVVGESDTFATFGVKARRSSTDFPLGSMELARQVGTHVGARHPHARVDLSDPDLAIHVEVVQASTYVYAWSVSGVGGLPVGTDGVVVSLLSSGIDSPVATWRMMRRGAVVVGVHFSGAPFTSGTSEEIVDATVRRLEGTAGIGRVYYIGFGEVQREVSLAVPPSLRVIVYRRLMVAVAERIAVIERGKALVTGESLGQVASQTLDNIRAVDDVATYPVLRPLIGSDKNEIISEAERLGTMEFSMMDSDDCCTLFMPRNPETHARLEVVRSVWESIDHAGLVDKALANVRIVDYVCPAYVAPEHRRKSRRT